MLADLRFGKYALIKAQVNEKSKGYPLFITFLKGIKGWSAKCPVAKVEVIQVAESGNVLEISNIRVAGSAIILAAAGFLDR